MSTELAVVICFARAFGAHAQQVPPAEPACPMHQAHAKLMEQGEQGMGFSQTATTHHFYLKPAGGVIQVEANSPEDTSNRDDVRMHLVHIAKSFSQGDFDIPMFVHGAVPPGVVVRKRKQDKIQYKFEETPNGGKLVITSSDKEAMEAIRGFLRFQIEQHKTGDATDQ